MVGPICHAGLGEAEAGRFMSLRPIFSTEWIPVQPELYRNILSWKTKKQKNKQVLRTPFASASWVLVLKKFVTMPGCCSTILHDPLASYLSLDLKFLLCYISVFWFPNSVHVRMISTLQDAHQSIAYYCVFLGRTPMSNFTCKMAIKNEDS